MGICTTLEKCLLTEKTVSDTFFEYIAPVLRREKLFFQRESNPILDHLGVDAILAYNNEIGYVDIKNHRCKDVIIKRPNYALELETSSPRDMELRECGWFVNKNKVTQMYVFLFWTGAADDINDMRVCIFKKSDIISKLKMLGIDAMNWKSITAALPTLYNGNLYWHLKNGMRIAQSLNLPEKPLNLVIPWQLLEDVAIFDEVFDIQKL